MIIYCIGVPIQIKIKICVEMVFIVIRLTVFNGQMPI